MSTVGGLHCFFTSAAAANPGRTAILEADAGAVSYGDLDRLSNLVRDRLHACGVRVGDRVGMALPKSIDAVATILGVLKVGAAYVPVDVNAPAARCAYILQNCGVRVVVTYSRVAEALRTQLRAAGAMPEIIVLSTVGGGAGLQNALEAAMSQHPAPVTETAASKDDDLAYILYTSGSTGKPKGVMLSHRNAISFVDWCSSVFEPTPADRFSSHAPFHFDLSILDLYLPLKHGATVVLVGEEMGKDPARLSKLIADQRMTCWYSAPSILSLLAQYGDLANANLSTLRLVLFAGEVFPIKHLRRLTQLLPNPRYFNLYGPTETNVCTFHEVELPVAESRTSPVPIGRVCSHARGRIVDEQGTQVDPGGEGELCIEGSGVMCGYWELPQQTARAFLTDVDGAKWYRTGDVVVEDAHGCIKYVGRRDRMVKRRGYRIELGEIEAALYRHEQISEAAVIAVPDEEAGVKIRAFLSSRTGERPSLIALKRFCSESLPLYMLPDQFVWCEAIPKTSTDKIDYQRLNEVS